MKILVGARVEGGHRSNGVSLNQGSGSGSGSPPPPVIREGGEAP
jgi:hypothetical protein